MEEMETNFYQNPSLLEPVPRAPHKKNDDLLSSTDFVTPALVRVQSAGFPLRSFSSPDDLFIGSHKT